MKNPSTDVLIIGGGLAGLTSAIHLSRAGLTVVLIEKNEYPKHKVCGEYISNEVLPYLQWLDADPLITGAKKIERFLLSTTTGKTTEARLPLGGFGVSRYTLDHFLAQKAIRYNCRIIREQVTNIRYEDEVFYVETLEGAALSAKMVIGAFGKRSNLDIKLDRSFIRNRTPFLAVKTHLKGDFPEDLVALHNFNGGYCGVSQVENGNLNVCYLANYATFRNYKNIDSYQKEVLYKNPHLEQVFENSVPVFEEPLTISQISFSDKSTVDNHMLMCGDAAGMIHPLCGNGMAMAIHSAKIASELLTRYFNSQIRSREELENQYRLQWNRAFSSRIRTGRILQTFFGKDTLARMIMYGVTHIPGVLPGIIRQTHGKPLNVVSA